MDHAGDWRRLCALLDDDEAVWLAVESALERGEDPWEALLDGLDDAGALAYLRSDDTGMELSDALAQLPRVFALQPDLDEVTDADDIVEAMRVADATLTAAGFRLVRLVERDDEESRPVVVVRDSETERITRLAGTVGGQAVAGG